MSAKTALIVEGGAMRTIFANGILDVFIERDFYPFDLYIGVSAGAANLAAYLGGKARRNYQVYVDFCQRPEFKSWRRFFKGGDYIDMDWLWDVTARQLPIGKKRIHSFGEKFIVVLTDIKDASAHYFSPQKHEILAAIKAAGTMPLFVKKAVSLRGREWVDGGVADSLPAEYAYNQGARKILVLRSQSENYRRKPYKVNKLFPKLIKSAAIAARLQRRHIEYNQQLHYLQNPPADCQILQIFPPEDALKKQFSNNIKLLNYSYQAGQEQGDAVIKAWQAL